MQRSGTVQRSREVHPVFFAKIQEGVIDKRQIRADYEIYMPPLSFLPLGRNPHNMFH
jgi:hypothetical protein